MMPFPHTETHGSVVVVVGAPVVVVVLPRVVVVGSSDVVVVDDVVVVVVGHVPLLLIVHEALQSTKAPVGEPWQSRFTLPSHCSWHSMMPFPHTETHGSVVVVVGPPVVVVVVLPSVVVVDGDVVLVVLLVVVVVGPASASQPKAATFFFRRMLPITKRPPRMAPLLAERRVFGPQAAAQTLALRESRLVFPFRYIVVAKPSRPEPGAGPNRALTLALKMPFT